MMIVRAVIAALMIGIGISIIVQMLRYPIAQTFTGVILGLAMIALGIFRLRQLIRYHRDRS